MHTLIYTWTPVCACTLHTTVKKSNNKRYTWIAHSSLHPLMYKVSQLELFSFEKAISQLRKTHLLCCFSINNTFRNSAWYLGFCLYFFQEINHSNVKTCGWLKLKGFKKPDAFYSFTIVFLTPVGKERDDGWGNRQVLHFSCRHNLSDCHATQMLEAGNVFGRGPEIHTSILCSSS